MSARCASVDERLVHCDLDGWIFTDPGWDCRWRTGGALEEVMEKAHLSAEHILAGIERFAGTGQPACDACRKALRAQQVVLMGSACHPNETECWPA